VIGVMRVRFLRWQEWRHLARERDGAYRRWRRAYYAYQDTAVVFGQVPGAWGDSGPVGQAQAETIDRVEELRAAEARLRRLEAS
jgi:hypothetical protein